MWAIFIVWCMLSFPYCDIGHIGQLILICGYHILPEWESSNITLFFFFFYFYHWQFFNFLKVGSVKLGKNQYIFGVLQQACICQGLEYPCISYSYICTTISKLILKKNYFFFPRGRALACLIQVVSSVPFLKWNSIAKAQIFLPCLVLTWLWRSDRT